MIEKRDIKAMKMLLNAKANVNVQREYFDEGGVALALEQSVVARGLGSYRLGG